MKYAVMQWVVEILSDLIWLSSIIQIVTYEKPD